MITTLILTTILVSLPHSEHGFSQTAGGTTSFPPNPVQDEKRARLNAKIQQAREHEEAKRWSEAETAYREAIIIRSQEGLPFGSRESFGLSRVLKAQGKMVAAMQACKAALAWSSKTEKWTVNGVSLCQVTAELAILASENGYQDLALEMYYAGLSSFQRRGTIETVPILVAFQASPGMTHWTYSVDRMKAASLALLIADGSFESSERENALDRIISIAPEWYWPHAYRTYAQDDPSYPMAISLCKNDQEREWLRRKIDRDEAIFREADEIRKNCAFIHVRNRNLLPEAEVVDW